MATKIDTIKLGNSEYEIDLKPTATPSIASLTTSGLTVNGDAWADAIATKSIDVGELTLDINGIRGPGVDVPILAESGDINLTASDGNININRTTSNATSGTITISNGRGDITLSTYEGNINIHATTSIPNSGGNITIGPSTLDQNTRNQTIILRGKVFMDDWYGDVTVEDGSIKAGSSVSAPSIYTSTIHGTESANSSQGIKLTATNITLSSGGLTGASTSVYGDYGVSISSRYGNANINAAAINLSSTGSIKLYGGSSSINLSCTTGSIYLKTDSGKIVLSTSGTSASNTLTISKQSTYGVSVSAGQGLYVTASKTHASGGLTLDLKVDGNSPFYIKPTGVSYVTGTWLVLGTSNMYNGPELTYSGTSSSSTKLGYICEIRASVAGNTLTVYLRSPSSKSESQLVSMSYTNPSYYCYIKNAHLIRLT